MKRLFAALAIVAVAGFGCAKTPERPVLDPNMTAYENADYGFTFAYPSNMEVRQREGENRASQYLGFDVDFFISLRDTVREKDATNIAWFYAAPGLSADAFTAALVASNPDGVVEVKSVEDVVMNGLQLKKVTSTTEMGTDKAHYLFDRNGTLIIVSVFLGEETAWNDVFQTLYTP